MRKKMFPDTGINNGLDKCRNIILAIVAVILLIIAAVYGVYHYEYSRLQKEDGSVYTDESVVDKVELSKTDEEVLQQQKDMESRTEDLADGAVIEAEGEIFRDSNVYNILLIGSDERTAKFTDDARGDTCMLLSLNKKTGEVHLISFERGMGMKILEGPYEGQFDWLTHTFWYGGGELMCKEISEHFKVDVDKFIRINIRTLINLVDAIGGVDVELNAKEANHLNHPQGTYTYGYITGMHVEDEMQEVKEGVNHLNGATAMVYARTRAIDDDWHRIQRQRKVVIAAVKKLGSLNTPEMISMLNTMIPMVQTNLSESDIANLLTIAPSFIHADVEQMTIPVNGTYGGMHGMAGRSLFAVDFDINSKVLKSELYGTPMPNLEEYEYQASDIYNGAGTKFAYTRNDAFDTTIDDDDQAQTGSTGKTYYSQNRKTGSSSTTAAQNSSNMTIDPQDIENMFSEDEDVAAEATAAVQKVFEAQYADLIKNAKTDEEAQALSEEIVKQQEETLKEAVAQQAQENAEQAKTTGKATTTASETQTQTQTQSQTQTQTQTQPQTQTQSQTQTNTTAAGGTTAASGADNSTDQLYNGMDYDTAVTAEEAFKKVQSATEQGQVPQLTESEYDALVKAAEAGTAQ